MVRMVTNRWAPDTCKCEIDFEFDADLDGDVRVHTGTNIHKPCPEHSGIGSPPDFYNALNNESQRKNWARQDILENISELGETKPYGDFDFKDGITFSWSWSGSDADRILHIQINGFTLTPQHKATIQTLNESRFGAGKVVID